MVAESAGRAITTPLPAPARVGVRPFIRLECRMGDPEISVEKDLLLAFPTPIMVHKWADSDALNKALRERILEARGMGAEDFANVVGGWSTRKDLLAWDADCVRELAGRMQRLLAAVVDVTSEGTQSPDAKFKIHSWANVITRGGYHAPHTHDNAYWSGVYYASVGVADENVPYNGMLELFDPRSAAGALRMHTRSTYQHKCRIPPEPGLMVLFPGWVKHMVHPFQGMGERISIAFNLMSV